MLSTVTRTIAKHTGARMLSSVAANPPTVASQCVAITFIDFAGTRVTGKTVWRRAEGLYTVLTLLPLLLAMLPLLLPQLPLPSLRTGSPSFPPCPSFHCVTTQYTTSSNPPTHSP